MVGEVSLLLQEAYAMQMGQNQGEETTGWRIWVLQQLFGRWRCNGGHSREERGNLSVEPHHRQAVSTLRKGTKNTSVGCSRLWFGSSPEMSSAQKQKNRSRPQNLTFLAVSLAGPVWAMKTRHIVPSLSIFGTSNTAPVLVSPVGQS